MDVDVPITHSARRYGYVFWLEEMDGQILKWIGKHARVPMIFEGDSIGERSVDWSRRRIYVGIPKTLAIDSGCSTFRLSYTDKKGLIVRCI